MEEGAEFEKTDNIDEDEAPARQNEGGSILVQPMAKLWL